MSDPLTLPELLHLLTVPAWMRNPTFMGMGAFADFDYAFDPASDLKGRLTRCYELASLAFVPSRMEHAEAIKADEPRLPLPAMLVHGSWQGPNEDFRIDHAWVLLDDGNVWEPISHLLYDRATFYSYTRAQDHVTYSQMETVLHMVRSNHHGPWDED